MSTNPQTTNEWGDTIVSTLGIRDVSVTINPKWRQFWKKPRTVFLQDSIQKTQNKMLKNIVERAFND